MKKETFEEAANKANGYNIYAKETKAPIFNEGFIAGAKWQAERMYSEEDVIKIVEKSRETGLTAEYLLLTFKQQNNENSSRTITN